MNTAELEEAMKCLECGLRGRLDLILNAVQPKLNEISVADAVKEVLQSKANRSLRRTYLNTMRSCLGIFAATFAGLLMAQVTAVQIEDWLDDDEWNSETQRGYLKNVRTLFSYAAKHQWVARNVALDVDWPASEPSAPGILTVAETQRLMRTCESVDPDFTAWLAVQLFGGLRVNEARSLECEQVNCQLITITPDKSKTRRRRLVTINPTLRAWLDAAGPIDSVNWRKRLAFVRKTAGVPWPRNCMRHSFVSYSLPIAGASATALQAGHSESVLFAHYRELVTPEQAAAFWNIRP